MQNDETLKSQPSNIKNRVSTYSPWAMNTYSPLTRFLLPSVSLRHNPLTKSGVSLDPATPRLLSEKELREQEVASEPPDSTGEPRSALSHLLSPQKSL